MSVTADILHSWRAPREVIRQHLRRPPTEAFAFSLLVAFLLLAFVSQWPTMARAAYLQPDVPLTQRMLAAGLALLASIPLWYAFAGLSHVIARAFGGVGGFLGARLALFWALLTVAPLMLAHGLLSGFIGQNAVAIWAGLAVLAIFVCYWLVLLLEVES